MQAADRVTEDEYLARERKAGHRSELVGGHVVAMAGASPRHNALVRNVVYLLTGSLRGKPCQPFGSDQRIHVPATGLYTYPDVSVVCGPLERHPKDAATLLNPRVLVEVLSESTEAYDRGAKFAHYRSIPTLQTYVMVVPDEVRVEVYERTDERWALGEIVGDGQVVLGAIDVSFAIGDVYAELPEGG